MSIAFGGMVAFFFRGVNLVVALGTVLFCTHQMTRDHYGSLVLGLTIIGVVNAASGGLTAATAYQVANQRRAPALAMFNGSVFSLGLGAVAVLTGLFVSSVLTGEAHRESLAIGLACAAIITNSVVAGAFLGRESLVRYNFALVCPPAFSLVAIAAGFALKSGENTPDIALEMYALGQWLAVAVLVLTGGISLRGVALETSVIRAIARFAVLAGVASGISYLNYRADVFVVKHFEGQSGVAVYSLAVYLAESVWQVSGSLALAAYARLGSLPRDEAARLTTRVMRHTVLLLGCICAVLFVSAGALQHYLFGSEYAGMASALRFLLPGVLLYGLAQSFSGFYTYQRGMPWVSSVVAGGGLIIDISLAFVLIPRMGVDGAALASACAYSTAILGGLIVFVRTEHLSPTQVFRFGRADVQDYRTLFTRLRALRG
ncbi:MAG: polysaccharide biosynthesis C-terminal domain-containing protein [Dehalococcoidia bacterium]|jgi:O-antigen/teichoic acid export membrane protein